MVDLSNTARQDSIERLSLPGRFPELSRCYVSTIAGSVSSVENLHAAISKIMVPHSQNFIHALVTAVKHQLPLSSELVAMEEKVMRQAVDAVGDDHGMAGSSARVTWLNQSINYHSCREGAGLDPTGKDQRSVELREFTIFDPRAYHEAVLRISPDTMEHVLGKDSCIGVNPTFVFEFGRSGIYLWDSIAPVVQALTGRLPTTFEDFTDKVKLSEGYGKDEGSYIVKLNEIEILLVPPS